MRAEEEPKPIGIILPMPDREREENLKFEKDVESALKRLETLLGIKFHTQETGDQTGEARMTYATRNGKDVVFVDGVHLGNRYSDILGLTRGDSRASALHYVLNNVMEISTDSETLEIPRHASTIDELVMKASISGKLKWRNKDNGHDI